VDGTLIAGGLCGCNGRNGGAVG